MSDGVIVASTPRARSVQNARVLRSDFALSLLLSALVATTACSSSRRRTTASRRSASWKAEVTDAGHWSFTDLCGITSSFSAGCGTHARQTVPSENVTYPPVPTTLALASTYATSFFAYQLLGDAKGKAELAKDRGAAATIDVRE